MQVGGGGDDVFTLLVRECVLCQGTTMYTSVTWESRLGIRGSRRVDARRKFNRITPFGFG